MGAPAAAALVLAALSALPCRGTDADGTSGIFNSTRNLEERGSQPTVNKAYQMLHTTELHNQSNLNSNTSVHSSYISTPTSVDKKNECCQTNAKDKQSLSPEGANLLTKNKEIESVDKELSKERKRRVVHVVKANANDSDSENEGRVEMTTKLAVVKTYRASDRKRKPGETGSSAPLLNYIFDSYSNTHHHGSARPGTGNSIYAAAAPEVEAFVGSTAHLDCKVDALHDKLVSWVRRKNNEDPMDLLTTGTQLYTADQRYSASFIPPDVWRLEVREVRPSDAAHYDCQLSAHPPRTARVTLKVPEVSVRIVDGAGAVVSEQVCEVGSTVALRCEVRGLRMEGGPSLLWYRRDALLNDDTTRGGISVRTEFGANGANSVLRVARVRADDAGSYTCAVAHAPPPEPPPAHVTLHIIKGESLAELHQGGVACVACAWIYVLCVCATLIYQRIL